MDLSDIPRNPDGSLRDVEWILEHRDNLTEGPFVDGVSMPVPPARMRHLVVAFGPSLVRAWPVDDPSAVIGEPRRGDEVPASGPGAVQGTSAPAAPPKPARANVVAPRPVLDVPATPAAETVPADALDGLDRDALKSWARDNGLAAFVDFRLGEERLRESLREVAVEAGVDLGPKG